MKLKFGLYGCTFLLYALSFAQSESKWQSLFNGQDLKGWRQVNGKAPYVAKNNEIVGTSVLQSPNSFLATEKEYGDFILELELLVDTLMNSGIQIRSKSAAEFQNGRVHGYQVEVDPSKRSWTGGIYEEALRGWLYPPELNPAAPKAFKTLQWNKIRVECIGNVIRTWVNGTAVACLIDAETAKGFIALQVHSTDDPLRAGKDIRWRNIRIQTENLKASPYDDIFIVNTIPNNLSPAEAKNGYSLLWDGESATGWRGVRQNKFPENAWEISHGELTAVKPSGAESPEGDIVTQKKFKFFELKFDFKLTKGAQSGIEYLATESGRNKEPKGLEYQIIDNSDPEAKMGTGNRTQASLYDLLPAKKNEKAGRKTGEWNQGIIRVYPNNKAEHWLNGFKLAEYTRGSAEYLAWVDASQYKSLKNFGMAKEGRILLQGNGGRVSFRSIKIREVSF